MARKQIAEPTAPKKAEKQVFLFPSGSTLFNLASSGSIRGFCRKGKMVNVIGDSNAGKSALTLTAQSAIYHMYGERFNQFHDDREKANTFDMRKLFGKGFAKFLREPPVPYGEISTVENFVRNIDAVANLGVPFVYTLDSWDVLKAASDLAKLDQLRKDEIAASYKTDKARAASDWLGYVNNIVSETGSLLLIISQSKANMGVNAMFSPKTRSGGASLRYYSSLECWLQIGGKIQSKVHKMPIGTKCVLRVSRSRLTGKERTVAFPIMNAYGIDDTTSCVDYLLEMGQFRKKKGGNIVVRGMVGIEEGTMLKRKELVSHIERNNLIPDLHACVQETWDRVEAEVVEEFEGRPPKFGE